MKLAVGSAAVALLLALCIEPCLSVKGGDCTPQAPSGVFELANLEHVDEFVADCDRIMGSLKISCDSSNETFAITNLEVFQFVTEIKGYLVVENCDYLTSLDGFRSLKYIQGEKLYGAEDYGLYISDNPLITHLGGLSNLEAVAANGVEGGANIYIMDNAALCYTDTADWSKFAGERWDRVVLAKNGASCAGSTCAASCSCAGCLGPLDEHCQAECSNDDDRDTHIIIGIIVGAIAFALLAFLIWMLLTRRCGCRLRVKHKLLQFGAVPGLPMLINDGDKSDDLPLAQTNGHKSGQSGDPRFRRAPSPKNDPFGAAFNLGGVGLPDPTPPNSAQREAQGTKKRRGSNKVAPM